MLSLLSIFGLALVDSLSAGTLVIPLVMVINQRGVNVRPLTIYFVTVCISYFLLGVAILFGFTQIGDLFSDAIESDPVLWIQLVVGVGLLLYGVLASNPKKSDITEARQPRNLSDMAMIGIAFTAVAVEAATMLPYLAALAILSDAAISTAGRIGVLAVYCFVMILPALIAIVLVTIFGDRIWPRLERFIRWVEHETKVTMLWIAAIAGFILAGNAATDLGLF